MRSCKYFWTRSLRTGRCLPGSSAHCAPTSEASDVGKFALGVGSLDGIAGGGGRTGGVAVAGEERGMPDSLIRRSPDGCGAGDAVLTADGGADGTLETGLGGSACAGLLVVGLAAGGVSADLAALEVSASFTFFNLGGPSVGTDGGTETFSVRPNSSSSTASDCRFFFEVLGTVSFSGLSRPTPLLSASGCTTALVRRWLSFATGGWDTGAEGVVILNLSVGTTASTLTSGTACFFDFLISSVFSAVDHTVKEHTSQRRQRNKGKPRLALSEVLLIHVRHKPNCISPTTVSIVFLRISRNEI